MLGEGHRRRQRGADVVVGFVECHGRPATEELIDDLEVVPRRTVDYRGPPSRRWTSTPCSPAVPRWSSSTSWPTPTCPAPGGNEKRWQDVIELLDAGIDVVTTVNIQHLESIADAVERIIEVPVRERVPDWVVRRADQIELVDSSPEQLRRRMMHGNIYPSDQVSGALAHYFRADHLAALRELALRFLADETEEQLLEYLRARRTDAVWETHERILVGVTTAPGTDTIVRRAARIASRLKADLDVLHVLSAARRHGAPTSPSSPSNGPPRTSTPSGTWSGVTTRRRPSSTSPVSGTSPRSSSGPVPGPAGRNSVSGGSVVRKVSRLAASAAIDVHIIARRELPPEPAVTPQAAGGS